MPSWACRLGAVACLVAVLDLSASLADAAYTDAKKLTFKGKFNPFKALELPQSRKCPDQETLKKAFKKQAREWHPDRCSRKRPAEECEARMEDVHLANEVLADERKLMQWEAWVEDSRSGGPKPGGNSRTGAAGQKHRHGSANANRGSPFGDMFGGGGGGFPPSPPRAQRTTTPPPRTTAPPPPNKPRAAKPEDWRILSREKRPGLQGATVEVIKRERDLEGLAVPMVSVEVVEKTCYPSQVQCNEEVIERRRHRKDKSKEEL